MLNKDVMSFVDTLPNKPFIKTRTRREIMKVYREEVPSTKPGRARTKVRVSLGK